MVVKHEHYGDMRMRAIWLVVSAAIALTGCAGDPNDESGAADCSRQVRWEGRLYASHGYTARDATKFDVADEADCHDTGVGPQGSVFPDNPEQVDVWSFEGYPTEKVLGVRFDDDLFAVFVDESVPRAESKRIFSELSEG